MTQMEHQPETLDQQITEFERQNPKVSEAMKLFGMTMARYQGALNAMYAPRISISSSAVPQDKTSKHE